MFTQKSRDMRVMLTSEIIKWESQVVKKNFQNKKKNGRAVEGNKED